MKYLILLLLFLSVTSKAEETKDKSISESSDNYIEQFKLTERSDKLKDELEYYDDPDSKIRAQAEIEQIKYKIERLQFDLETIEVHEDVAEDKSFVYKPAEEEKK
jgi:hypothetical protein